jgi:hypothetical protein
MKILVATSDNYSHLIEPYFTLFNRYWPDQEIVFLGFSDSNLPPLPTNCTFHSLGNQSDFGSLWTDPLIPFIDSLEDEYFVFTVEDVMLMYGVDVEKAALLENEVESGQASKAMLDSHLIGSMEPYKKGLLQLTQGAMYRTSLGPAIWRKDYFKKFLRAGHSAWDFEMKNMSASQHDGAIIVGLDTSEDLYYTTNVYRKGIPFPRPDCPRTYGTSGEQVDMDVVNYISKFIKDD